VSGPSRRTAPGQGRLGSVLDRRGNNASQDDTARRLDRVELLLDLLADDLGVDLHHLEIAQRPTVRYGTPTSFEEVEVCLLIGTIDADIALEWLR